MVFVQIGQCSVDRRGDVLSRPVGRCDRAFRVTDAYKMIMASALLSGAQRVGLWLCCICAGDQSPDMCIVAAFATHQWTSAVLEGRCI